MRLNLGHQLIIDCVGLDLEKNTGARVFRRNGEKGDILQKEWKVKRTQT